MTPRDELKRVSKDRAQAIKAAVSGGQTVVEDAHFLPEGWLGQWHAADGKLNVTDVRGWSIKKRKTADSYCFAHALYAVRRADGTIDDSVEIALGRDIETPLGKLIPRFSTQEETKRLLLSGPARVHIAMFVASTIMRSPKAILWLLEEVYRITTDAVTFKGNPSESERETWIRSSPEFVRVSDEMARGRQMEWASAIAGKLVGMKWHWVVFERPSLIASDAPVVYTDGTMSSGRGKEFVHPRAADRFYMPVTPRVALFIEPGHYNDGVVLFDDGSNERLADIVNAMVASNADEWFFLPEGLEELQVPAPGCDAVTGDRLSVLFENMNTSP